MTCDRAWEIDALREGKLGVRDAEAFERHLRVCADCAAEKSNADHLRDLGRAVVTAEPAALDVRRVRHRVLRSRALGEQSSASDGRGARSGVVAIVAALALAAGAFVVVRHRGVGAELVTASAVASAASSSPAFAGTVEPVAGAVWTQTRVDRVEHVKLDEGSLHIHVRHQESGERFLVDVPDGNLEVRGTTFDVETHAGATELVSVEEGVVAWRRKDDAELVLRAGESWAATKPPAVAHSVASARSTSHPTTDVDDGSGAYAAALATFRRGSYLEASSAFEHFLAAHPHADETEDASYLDALSLARAGRADAAAVAAGRHLAAFPSSFHRKDASILVARAARDHGDCEEVRRVLAPWLGASPDSEATATSASCVPKP